ncbi:glutaredoxin family protein [Catenuloplanes indicus JCM 9534]
MSTGGHSGTLDRVQEPRLTLITRPGCHLCEVAKEAVGRVVAATGDRYVEIDVESDIELEREYGERVPVVLLDGREHGYWRVEEARLLADLAQPR